MKIKIYIEGEKREELTSAYDHTDKSAIDTATHQAIRTELLKLRETPPRGKSFFLSIDFADGKLSYKVGTK